MPAVLLLGLLLLFELLLAHEQLIGQRRQVGAEMAADHIAKQRLQVARDLIGESARGAAALGGARDHGLLERDRGGDPLGQLGAALARGAQRGDSPGEQSARRALGLQQGAQREQVVAQGFEQALPLTAQLEATQRPGELVALRRTSGHEVAEGSQLVLLLGGDCKHPLRPWARSQCQGLPRAGADPPPGERPERDAPVSEQPQRAQEVPEGVRPARARQMRVIVIGCVHDHEMTARRVVFKADPTQSWM